MDTDIKLDLGHVLLLVALVVFVLFVANGCSLSCGNSENLDVPKFVAKECHCKSCAEACYERALNGELDGCNEQDPNYDQCNNSYRTCLLGGCGVA